MFQRTTICLVSVAVVFSLGIGCNRGPKDAGEEVAAATTTGTNVLELVPASSDAVIYLPSLSQLAEGIDAFASQVGEEDAGAVAALAEIEGLNPDGTAIVFITDIAAMTDSGGPVFALIPIDDFGDLLDEVDGESGNIAEIPLPMGIGKAYAQLYGDYAMVSLDKDLLEAYEPPEESFLSAPLRLTSALVDKSDFTVFLNMQALGPIMMASIDNMMAMTAAMGEEMMGLDEVMDMYRNFLGTLASDSTWIAFGADVDGEHVGFSMVTELREGSPLAAALPAVPSATPLWEELPADSFIFAAVTNLEGIDLSAFFGDIDQLDPSPGFGSLLAGAWRLYEHMDTMTMAYYVPTGDNQEATALTIVNSSNPDAYSAGFRSYLESMNALDNSFPGVGGPASLSFTTTYEPANPAVPGSAFDHYVSTQVISSVTPGMSDPTGMMAFMGGLMGSAEISDDGRRLELTTEGWVHHDGQRIITLNRNNPELLQNVSARAASSNLSTAPVVAAVQGWQLAEDSNMQVVIDSQTALTWANSLSDSPAELPATPLEPAAFFINMSEREVAYRMVVTPSVIKVLGEWAENMVMANTPY